MLEAIGATLRAAREARGWTIEEVEKATRIRARYLAALEAGEVDSLPSPLQMRGFLRNYAQHLNLNPDQVLAQLDEALKPARRGLLPSLQPRGKSQTRASAKTTESASPTSPVASVRRLRRLFTPDILIAAIAIAVVIGFFVWGGLRIANTVLNPPAVTPTPEVLGPTNTPTPTIISGVTPSATPLPPVVSFSNVQLALVVERRTFVRVLTDGAVAFEGILLPDERREFVAQSVVEVTTGDGSSVRVILNQRDLGLMGNRGEVITRQYLPTGIITVTPTITLTPTLTLTPSETPTPTPSLTATRAPTATRRP
ncbi:MAG: DUF4115 domain-containing protein [Chloroflexi bacterium]|nr:DUF4115 domain-containing protein [Chloroflexota bacterium]